MRRIIRVPCCVTMASGRHRSDKCDVSELTTRGNVLPLNSKRLTAALLRQLAAALDVLTSASVEDLRQLITGELEEDV